MNHSTPGLTDHHQLPEFTHIHLHRVSDAIEPSHPLSSPSSPALNLSWHQSLLPKFKWLETTKVLPVFMNLWVGWVHWLFPLLTGFQQGSPSSTVVITCELAVGVHCELGVQPGLIVCFSSLKAYPVEAWASS